MNRIANAGNPYQGKKLKVLCVCSAGLLRSPTTANVLHREHGYNTRAVGVSQEYALIPLDVTHLHWADEIVCMENSHMMALHSLAMDWGFTEPLKLTVLDIPDNYGWMDEELQEIIKTNYLESLDGESNPG